MPSRVLFTNRQTLQPAIDASVTVEFSEEAILGGVVRNSFVFVEFEEGGAFEVVLLAVAAFGLEGAELVECLLELAGEALAVEAEGGEGGYGFAGVGAVDGREEVGFQKRYAIEAPSGIGEFLD